MPIYFQIQPTKQEEISPECVEILLYFIFSSSAGSEEFSVKLRCRRRHESFLFTFKDHDGSVQSAAAIEPLTECPKNICPVLLTLHGTGVLAQNQADGYKRMKDNDWIFGLENTWVLAPTRHGAHNWEGPGALTAITALNRLKELTTEADWLSNKASAHHVIFAGHSMGGHGSWHLATHYPDRALAVISLAGWIKKEEYGDSNEFFRFDLSTSHTDPSLKAVMEACIAENDADRHVSNLKGLPVLARIGAEDRTVHPFFVRRMVRLLKEAEVNITYSELPGKQHWWWDTWKTNDGGAVNDPELRKFTNSHAVIRDIDEKDGACISGGSDCSSEELSKNRYTKAASEVKYFKLTVVNPAFGEGMNGIRVLQQRVPFRVSSIEMEFNYGDVYLLTTNVKRLSISQKSYLRVNWRKLRIKIDSDNVMEGKTLFMIDDEVHFCLSEGHWLVCSGQDYENLASRGPVNYGPARRVAESKFIIVTGTQKKDKIQPLLQMSSYIANLFYLTSDTIAPILPDDTLSEEYAENHNLIVVGDESENIWTKRYLERVPLKINQKGFNLGSCVFKQTHSGALFLAPHGKNGLALILIGQSEAGLNDVIRLATPTIPPMTRSPFSNLIPDYVITGPDVGIHGPGGYLCAGFWGNQWDYRPELSSCAC